ncbi:TPA: hypothetical protein DCX15_00835 [bacterium]|nr:hypothetical protein [bacterium]
MVIMAGGRGTRLRPLTYSVPKPLLPVGETPILELMIKRLSSLGFKEITLMTGYRSELIEAYFGDGTKLGVKLKYVKEERVLGTAGPLRLLEDLGQEPVLVMNGDILTKLDFKRMIDFHLQNGADLTIGTRIFQERLLYGVIEGKEERVTKIDERPILELEVSAGIYLLDPALVQLIPSNTLFGMPELINRAIEEGKRVYKYPIKEYWLAIEKIDDLNGAMKEIRDW